MINLQWCTVRLLATASTTVIFTLLYCNLWSTIFGHSLNYSLLYYTRKAGTLGFSNVKTVFTLYPLFKPSIKVLRHTSAKNEHAYSKFTSSPSFLNGASSKASTSRSSAIFFFDSAVEAWMITGKSGSKVSLEAPCISPTTVCQLFSQAS